MSHLNLAAFPLHHKKPSRETDAMRAIPKLTSVDGPRQTAKHPAHDVDQHCDNGQTDEHRQGVVASSVKTDAPKK